MHSCFLTYSVVSSMTWVCVDLSEFFFRHAPRSRLSEHSTLLPLSKGECIMTRARSIHCIKVHQHYSFTSAFSKTSGDKLRITCFAIYIRSKKYFHIVLSILLYNFIESISFTQNAECSFVSLKMRMKNAYKYVKWFSYLNSTDRAVTPLPSISPSFSLSLM